MCSSFVMWVWTDISAVSDTTALLVWLDNKTSQNPQDQHSSLILPLHWNFTTFTGNSTLSTWKRPAGKEILFLYLYQVSVYMHGTFRGLGSSDMPTRDTRVSRTRWNSRFNLNASILPERKSRLFFLWQELQMWIFFWNKLRVTYSCKLQKAFSSYWRRQLQQKVINKPSKWFYFLKK